MDLFIILVKGFTRDRFVFERKEHRSEVSCSPSGKCVANGEEEVAI